jgi:predicted nucleic acid-binding protein
MQEQTILTKPNPKNFYVLLDSNVIQHFANEELGLEILANLGEAYQAGYKPAISDFTFLELLDGSSVEKEVERINALKNVKRFYVRKDVLIAAGHLGSIYLEDGFQIKDIGDKIIGATALLSNSLIYTFNGRDFPRPFFNEVAVREVRYAINGEPKMMVAYFISPNFEYIGSKYQERMRPIQEKMLESQKAETFKKLKNSETLTES